MIIAVVPLPQRHNPGEIIYNKKLDCYYDPNAQRTINVACGRNFMVPPAFSHSLQNAPPIHLFKVVSTWDNVLYEHIFLSYHKLHPFYLTNDGYPVELFPISVKRYGESGTGTYLFIEPINSIFQDPNYKNWCLARGHDVLDEVVSLPTFLERCLSMATDMLPTPWSNKLARTALGDRMSKYLTPTVPTQATNLYNEIMQYCGNPDGLYSYLDDMGTYSMGNHFSPEQLSLDYEYNWMKKVSDKNGVSRVYDVDPITVLCLNTPTSVTSLRLLPFLGTEQMLKGHLALAAETGQYNPGTEVFKLDSEFAVNTTDSNYLDDLVEALCKLAATDVVIFIKNTGDILRPIVQIEQAHMFTAFANCFKSEINDIHVACMGIVREYDKTRVGWDTITITKNWLDEIYMVLVDKEGRVWKSHMTLTFYHLASSSLINQHHISMFQKFT